MNAFESALESWDLILFDGRTFRSVRTPRENSSSDLSHKWNYGNWAKITKMWLQSKISRVNCNILIGREIWSYFPESNTNRPIFGRVAEISMAELPKPTNQKSKNHKKSIFSKIRSRGRSTLGIGAKHI